MKALVYHGPGKKTWEEKPKPVITEPTDAILKVLKTTICGTDLHIMKRDTHSFKLEQIIQAYDTFEHASKEKALKIILTN